MKINWKAGAAVAVVGMMIAASWLAREPDTVSRSIQDEWAKAIAPLGIASIFPPTEDMQVGDVFAVAWGDDGGKLENAVTRSFEGRSIKMTHIDLTLDLQETYKSFRRIRRNPQEKSSTGTTKGDGEAVDSHPKFENGSVSGVLPTVMLPTFSTLQKDSGTANGGGLVSKIAAFFSIAGERYSEVTVGFPDAVTYGVPSLRGRARLEAYCSDQYTRIVCSERSARVQLSNVIGPVMLETEKINGRCQYKIGVAILLVSRLYIVKSMAVSEKRFDGGAIAVAAGGQANEKLAGASPASGEESRQTGGTRPDSGGQDGALMQELKDMRARLATYEKRLADVQQRFQGSPETKGAVSISRVGGTSLILEHRELPHPVAIGFRSIVRPPHAEVPQC